MAKKGLGKKGRLNAPDDIMRRLIKPHFTTKVEEKEEKKVKKDARVL